jgi:transcription elongation factor GreA
MQPFPDFEPGHALLAGRGCVMIDIRKRLEDEIKTLDFELKVQLPKEIQRAREYGDLRENAEYKAAKERQTFLQARISQLQMRVVGLSMINLDKLPLDKVGLGSTVHVKDTTSGAEIIYNLVTPEESDPTIGRISPSSPIGRCLLNHEEGDVVEVKVPSGTKEYEITKLVTLHQQAE